LQTTQTELKAMQAAAIMGVREMPKSPAAAGMAMTL
jgi:hypothetical protein